MKLCVPAATSVCHGPMGQGQVVTGGIRRALISSAMGWMQWDGYRAIIKGFGEKSGWF